MRSKHFLGRAQSFLPTGGRNAVLRSLGVPATCKSRRREARAILCGLVFLGCQGDSGELEPSSQDVFEPEDRNPAAAESLGSPHQGGSGSNSETGSFDCDPDIATCLPGDAYFEHPLRGVALVDGGYPFVDSFISPEGRAYALTEGGYSTDEGEYVSFGGALVELERRAMTDAELAEALVEESGEAETEGPMPTKIGAGLLLEIEAAIAEEDPERLINTSIVVDRGWTGTVNSRLHRYIAQGQIAVQSDRDFYRQLIADELAAQTTEAMGPLVATLEENGAELEFVGDHISSVQARVPAALLLQLLDRADVERLDQPPMTALAVGADGQDRAEALQLWSFWDESFVCGSSTCNYDGENGGGTDIHVAVADLDQFRDEHVAFRESNSATLERIAGMWDCDGTCSASPLADAVWTPPEGPHGTGVLGALLADYRDAQDAAITDVDVREQHSGGGGEARAYLYDAEVADLQKVLNHIASASVSPKPHFAVVSMGDPHLAPDFGDCNGTTDVDKWVDQNFINGYGYFTPAGNDLDAPESPQDMYDDDGISGTAFNCTAWDPASAMGAFAVGAYDGGNGDPALMRHAAPHAESAWGGSTVFFTEGRGRSVVNLVGPWAVAVLPTDSSNTNYANYIGTSFANPTVAGAAVAFVDMMKNLRGSSLIDDPGMLYAWMLNMGDRGIASGSGPASYTTSGFNPRMGAGRAAMRFVGNAGMDSPWYWYHYETCVAHGTTTTVLIDGGSTLSTSVDSIRATAWWFDRRFSDGTTTPDNINLALKKTDNTSLVSSASLYDNKERVYYNDVGGLAVKLEISGASVTSDGEGCGTNSMRVWVTILVESDARNDADGPDWDGLSSVGVQPL